MLELTKQSKVHTHSQLDTLKLKTTMHAHAIISRHHKKTLTAFLC